jgi:hypothetical protein
MMLPAMTQKPSFMLRAGPLDLHSPRVFFDLYRHPLSDCSQVGSDSLPVQADESFSGSWPFSGSCIKGLA